MSSMGGEDFEMTQGRVKVAKQVRKLRDRLDSLDDHSSDSEEEVFVSKKKGKTER
jgi:hypothetical protein